MTVTLLDRICEIVSEVDMREDQAKELNRLMTKFREERSVSYRNLQRIPGFRKFWDAINEAVDRACYEYQIECDTILGPPTISRKGEVSE